MQLLAIKGKLLRHVRWKLKTEAAMKNWEHRSYGSTYATIPKILISATVVLGYLIICCDQISERARPIWNHIQYASGRIIDDWSVLFGATKQDLSTLDSWFLPVYSRSFFVQTSRYFTPFWGHWMFNVQIEGTANSVWNKLTSVAFVASLVRFNCEDGVLLVKLRHFMTFWSSATCISSTIHISHTKRGF